MWLLPEIDGHGQGTAPPARPEARARTTCQTRSNIEPPRLAEASATAQTRRSREATGAGRDVFASATTTSDRRGRPSVPAEGRRSRSGRERAFGGIRSRGGRVDVPRPASDDERPERGRERGALALERRERPGEPPFAFLRQVEWPDAGVAGGHGTADQAEVLRASRELRRRALA